MHDSSLLEYPFRFFVWAAAKISATGSADVAVVPELHRRTTYSSQTGLSLASCHSRRLFVHFFRLAVDLGTSFARVSQYQLTSSSLLNIHSLRHPGPFCACRDHLSHWSRVRVEKIEAEVGRLTKRWYWRITGDILSASLTTQFGSANATASAPVLHFAHSLVGDAPAFSCSLC